MSRERTQRPRRWRRRLAWALGAIVFAVALWTWWGETHPRTERELRLALRAQLEAWFPEAMQAPEGTFGLFPREPRAAEAPLTVVLVHGLDEPGDIWDDLREALADRPWPVWELRYPNDQGIDRSAAFLAGQWSTLPADRPVVLIGHSMGGLVIREFVSAWRHPVEGVPSVEGAPVRAALLVGTPNHGSDWARLRCWLELRDHFPDDREREFSLFAALRDGLGTAKVDLRPGSDFLNTLNARAWPADVDLRLIAGDVMNEARLRQSLEALIERAPDAASAASWEAWWERIRTELGDGVVTVDSVALEGVAPPVVFPASHRGLVRRSVFEKGDPPAIPVLLDWIDAAAQTRRD